MIIQCENCSRKFIAKDNDIPKEGRMVQCGYCSVAWHQMPVSAPTKVLRQTNINESSKEIDEALQINLKLAKVHHALFVESSPGPIKFAAELLDLCSSETRLPLVPIKDSTKILIRESMIEAGLISQ